MSLKACEFCGAGNCGGFFCLAGQAYNRGKELASERSSERARIVAILKRRAESAHVNTAFELRDAINEIEGRDCNDPRAVG